MVSWLRSKVGEVKLSIRNKASHWFCLNVSEIVFRTVSDPSGRFRVRPTLTWSSTLVQFSSTTETMRSTYSSRIVQGWLDYRSVRMTIRTIDGIVTFWASVAHFGSKTVFPEDSMDNEREKNQPLNMVCHTAYSLRLTSVIFPLLVDE